MLHVAARSAVNQILSTGTPLLGFNHSGIYGVDITNELDAQPPTDDEAGGLILLINLQLSKGYHPDHSGSHMRALYINPDNSQVVVGYASCN